MSHYLNRKYPIGAEWVGDEAHFRVFAPKAKKIDLVLGETLIPLNQEPSGYFNQVVKNLEENCLYSFRVDGEKESYPDPASRFQPFGPFGPSEVIRSAFNWTDAHWKGIEIEQAIIYEMHIGTFTQEGTFLSAIPELKELAKLGITVIEVMPIHEFPGNFGWGYDGVNLFAPTSLYGRPEDVKTFINEAHRLNLAVILDVVYNHFGPEANFIEKFSSDYFKNDHTEWGRSINFDHPDSRLFFLTNVRYWIEEFHFDGLRVDATQVIHSTTPIHVLKEIAECAKVAGGKRKIIVIGENEAQESILLRTSSEGGYEFDALWNDDFHHSAIVKLTGKREAYYSDYSGHCQELLSCLKHGFLYQGQYYSWQKKYRGSSTLGLHPKNFVLFLQNHDQIANSGKGSRIHELAHPGNYKAMTCLMLIAPGTPLLFQGQEFASSSCFVYFADHDYKLSKLIDRGRKEFLSQFPHITDKKVLSQLPNPANVEVFLKSKLDFSEREKNAPLYKLHQDLIALRKSDPIFSHADPLFDGAVLSNDTFLIRYFADKHDRLLLFNFAGDFEIKPLSCPLLALPQGCKWKLLWSSESTDYGGQGTPPLDDTTWIVPAHSALILQCKEC